MRTVSYNMVGLEKIHIIKVSNYRRFAGYVDTDKTIYARCSILVNICENYA